MKKIYFNIDELSDTIVVSEVDDLSGGLSKKKYRRIDYTQFYELMTKVKERQDGIDEKIRKEQLERLKREANGQKQQSIKISNILYNDLRLTNPLKNVIAIEERDSEDNDFKYNIYLEINSRSNYAFRKILTDETYTIGSQTYPLYKRCSIDYGSQYIVTLPITINNSLSIADVKVNRKYKNHSGEEISENIPYLEEMYMKKLIGKNLHSLTNIDVYNNVFNSLSQNIINESPLLRQRIEESKQNKTMINWEGVV